MTMFPPTSSLFRPTDDDRVPVGTLGYFQARNRNRLYELVLREFEHSGISQAALARRLGKRPDQICRWLGAPGNWGLDTVSDLLFAISGAEPEYRLAYPLDSAQRNFNEPEWLIHQTSKSTDEPIHVETGAPFRVLETRAA